LKGDTKRLSPPRQKKGSPRYTSRKGEVFSTKKREAVLVEGKSRVKVRHIRRPPRRGEKDDGRLVVRSRRGKEEVKREPVAQKKHRTERRGGRKAPPKGRSSLRGE